MGKIDVTEVLRDPDMVDKLTLIHRISRVDGHGENTIIKEEVIQTYGVVVPASGKTFMRLPEAFQVANVMSFFIKGKIISDGLDRYPDIIKLNGVRFQVQVVFDYTNWGAGWCEGTCVREKAAI